MSRTPQPPLLPDPDAVLVVQAMLDKRQPDPALAERFFAPEAMATRTARADAYRARDWPALARYRAANEAAGNSELVMIGDSLTEIWGHALPGMFGGTVANRGISGQTSGQILLRFHADVIELKPKRVHILCGTNDIAGNTGPNLPEDYQRNIRAMADLAAANGIEVLIASLTPAATVFWSPAARPLEWIPTLNDWLRSFAAERGLRFVDYHSALTDGTGGLRDEFSADGVHVTRSAYRVMQSVLEATDSD
jgi:lysophospholipase L1-like esterase